MYIFALFTGKVGQVLMKFEETGCQLKALKMVETKAVHHEFYAKAMEKEFCAMVLEGEIPETLKDFVYRLKKVDEAKKEIALWFTEEELQPFLVDAPRKLGQKQFREPE
jgi:nucleoside diphosphate kinase